jgi:hypothetical protein
MEIFGVEFEHERWRRWLRESDLVNRGDLTSMKSGYHRHTLLRYGQIDNRLGLLAGQV